MVHMLDRIREVLVGFSRRNWSKVAVEFGNTDSIQWTACGSAEFMVWLCVRVPLWIWTAKVQYLSFWRLDNPVWQPRVFSCPNKYSPTTRQCNLELLGYSSIHLTEIGNSIRRSGNPTELNLPPSVNWIICGNIFKLSSSELSHVVCKR